MSDPMTALDPSWKPLSDEEYRDYHRFYSEGGDATGRPSNEEAILRLLATLDAARSEVAALRGLLAEARDCVALCSFDQCKGTLARIDSALAQGKGE